MKKILLGLGIVLWSGAAVAQWQVPLNNIPFGRGAGTGFSSAAAAANSILATGGTNIPGLTQTLPNAVQDNITRLGTLTAGVIPPSLIQGNVPLNKGGTNASLTASLGGIVYGDAAGMAFLANPAASGRIVASVNGAAPVWTTASYPTTAPQGTMLNAATGNTISATRTPVIGLNGTAGGTFGVSGATTGTVTIGVQAAAGTYNFNLPTAAGTSGHALLSGGGGASAMTFGILGITAGGTGANNAAATANRYLKGDGIGYVMSSGSASGIGTCGGGQFVTATNSDAAPTCATPAGGGDVTGPASSVDNQAALFNSTSGKLLKAATFTNGIEVSGTNVQITAARRTLPTIQRFLSGTAATYTTPANVLWIKIRMVGAGGGGSPSIGTSSAATNGTASTWSGGTLSAGGGLAASGTVSGAGGTASNGNMVSLPGAAGHQGLGFQAADNGPGGNGGSSCYGGGGQGGAVGSNPGVVAGANTGGGGGGGGLFNSTNSGAGGGAGACIEHIITSPAASYTYTVGVGGSAGVSSGGQHGAAGGAGMILVEEYYN